MEKFDVLKKGNDICLIGTGYGSILSLQSYPMIEDQLNVSVKIINLSTIKPIDTNRLINEIKSVKGIVIIEEHNIYCGLGSILARIIAENNPMPMKFVGINDSFCESGKREEVLASTGLYTKNIIKQVRNLIRIKNK